MPNWVKVYRLDFLGEIKKRKKGFLTLHIEKNCSFSIQFESSIIIHKKANYAWFSKGPLVYSYDPENIIQIDSEKPSYSKEFPAYNIYAKNFWAYGVTDDCKVVENNDGTLSISAYKLSNWEIKKVKRLTGDKENKNCYSKNSNFLFMPPIPLCPKKYGEEQNIKLIPYGKTLCRITAFPRIKSL